MQKPHAEAGETCPFNGKDVSKVCHKCPLYVHIRGKDPQSGQDVDEWGCSFAFMPVLLIENAQQSRQTGAAVESFRNEVVKENAAFSQAIRLASEPAPPMKLIEGK